MGGRIVVVNPNSTQAVTDGIDEAVAPLRFAEGPAIDCLTLAQGPPGIETQRHVDSVVAPLCDLIRREDNTADAFVVACFSDPGLHSARETTAKPVLGISECAIGQALVLGDRFAIIAILPASLARHRRYIRQLGLAGRFAGERPIGVGVTDLEGEAVAGRMAEVARALVRQDGADVVILGCAGMARYRARLADETGVPVIDPSQAAVAQALAAVRFGLTTPSPGRA